MENRRRVSVIIMASTAVGLTVGAACSSDPMRMVGDAMVDAGHMLDGAADALVPDAAAAPVAYDVNCDMLVSTTTTQVTSGGTTYVTQNDTWYAMIPIAGLVPARVKSVSGVVCDYELFSASDPPPCPMGVTCTGDTPLPLYPRAGECEVVAGGLAVPGGVRVWCGNRARTTTTPPPAGSTGMTDGGARAHTAHVYVETL